jgi:hypothetical protein
MMAGEVRRRVSVARSARTEKGAVLALDRFWRGRGGWRLVAPSFSAQASESDVSTVHGRELIHAGAINAVRRRLIKDTHACLERPSTVQKMKAPSAVPYGAPTVVGRASQCRGTCRRARTTTDSSQQRWRCSHAAGPRS